MKRLLLILSLGLLAFGLWGCEDEEMDKLARAQQCLDAINDSNTSQAQQCIDIVSGLGSAQSYVIRCSAEFLKGGVTSTRIANSFNKLANATDKDAAFMGALALGGGGSASLLQDYCKKSEVPGLFYLGTMSSIGTRMASAAGLTGNINDPNFPNGTQTNNLISSCQGDAANCNNAETGQLVFDVHQVYCQGNNESNEMCQNISTAIAASGGSENPNYANLMAQLLAGF